MITGITSNGEMKNVKVEEDGSIAVNVQGELEKIKINQNGSVPAQVGDLNDIRVNSDGSVPVVIEGADEGITVVQTSDKEVTLLADVLTLSTSNTTIAINKKVTNIMLANYSEEADVSVTVGSKTLEIGANLALEFPMNEEITNLVLTATAADTKVQLVVKGVEVDD